MAKDTTVGPVSKPEGGHYESSEEIRMANKELSQTEVMSEFDKDLAAMLVEGGYHSLFQLAHESDGVLMDLKGVGLEELAVIREKAPYEPLIPTPAEEPVLAEVEIEIEVEEAETEVEVEVKEGEEPAEEEELPELADLVVGPVEPDTPVEPPKSAEDLVLEVFGNKTGSILMATKQDQYLSKTAMSRSGASPRPAIRNS